MASTKKKTCSGSNLIEKMKKRFCIWIDIVEHNMSFSQVITVAKSKQYLTISCSQYKMVSSIIKHKYIMFDITSIIE